MICYNIDILWLTKLQIYFPPCIKFYLSCKCEISSETSLMSQQVLIAHIYIIVTNHQIYFYLVRASTFFIKRQNNVFYHIWGYMKSLQRWKTIKRVNKLTISNDYAFYDVISKLFPRVLVWVTLDFSHNKRKVFVYLYKVDKVKRCINVILKGYKCFL